jgi:predicted heme/steroid binding protein
MTELPQYTKSQLALRNGQDKPEIWVAYKGLIYDVSESRLWRKGATLRALGQTRPDR